MSTPSQDLQNEPLITKREALRLLSVQLRKPRIDGAEFCKVLALYSKLSGWDEEDSPNPGDEEVNLDKLVAAMEKKRKQNG